MRHPWATVLIAFAAAMLALAAAGRITANPSLASMFPRDDPAADALVGVLERFAAVEELLLLVTLPEPASANEPPDAPRLLAFANRLEAAVRDSPEASAMSDGVLYRADPQTRRFFETVLVPSGLYYLDAAEFEAVRARLTPDGMREQIRQNEAMASAPGPAAQALAEVLLKDPLRLREFVTDRLAAQRPFKTYQGGDAFVSEDGRALLIRVIGKRPPGDLEFSKAFLAAIGRLADGANADGLRVRYSGSYAIAAAGEKSIRADSISSTIFSVIYLGVLFVLAYRGPVKLFTLAFGPVVLGNLLGFGAYSFWSSALTPMTAVIGAMLAEMGINYSIHYLSQYDAERSEGFGAAEAAGRTTRDLALPLGAAWVTSVVGFLAVGFSSVRALRDFAVLGTLALAGAVLTTLALLPAVLALTDRRAGAGARPQTRLRFGLEPVLARIGRRRRASVALLAGLALAALCVIAAPGKILSLETDLTVMHPRPNAPLDTQDEIARRFGAAPASLIVHLRADSSDALLRLAHETDARLAGDSVRAAGVTGAYGLATLLPDPALAAGRARAFTDEQAGRVVADFKAAVADSIFDPGAYEPYAAFLRLLLTRRSGPGVSDLLLFDPLARTVLPTSALWGAADRVEPREAVALVSLNHSLEDRDKRAGAIDSIRRAIRDLPGATLTGLSVIGHDTESIIHRDLPRMLSIGIGAVVLYLLAHFRSVRDTALALLPTAFSLLCLTAAMRLAGQKLNMVNLVAAPLLIGIDVDYGIFLVSMARTGRAQAEGPEALVKRIAPACHAVLLCGLTTVLGFGSLYFTSVPAIRSLGFAIGVGVIACVVGTFLLLVPLLIGMAARRAARVQAPVGGRALVPVILGGLLLCGPAGCAPRAGPTFPAAPLRAFMCEPWYDVKRRGWADFGLPSDAVDRVAHDDDGSTFALSMTDRFTGPLRSRDVLQTIEPGLVPRLVGRR